MPSTRLALCIASLAFGCSQSTPEATPRAQAAAETPASAERAEPNSADQLRAWIPAANGAAANPGAAAPAAAAPSGTNAPAPTAHGETRGVVRETMNSGGYTYMRLETSGGERWVATTEMPLHVGDTVSVDGGDVMNGFHSRTLNRTFDSIVFAGAVHVAGANGAAAPAPTAPAAPEPPTQASPGLPAGAVIHGTVRETMNSGGYTYLRVENAQGSTWAAIPQTTVAVGAVVDVMPGNEMPGFHSRTLDRTFPQLTFSPGLRGAGVAGAAPTGAANGVMPAGHPAMGQGTLPPGHPALGTASPGLPGASPVGALPPGHPAIGQGALPAGHPAAPATH